MVEISNEDMAWAAKERLRIEKAEQIKAEPSKILVKDGRGDIWIYYDNASLNGLCWVKLTGEMPYLTASEEHVKPFEVLDTEYAMAYLENTLPLSDVEDIRSVFEL